MMNNAVDVLADNYGFAASLVGELARLWCTTVKLVPVDFDGLRDRNGVVL